MLLVLLFFFFFFKQKTAYEMRISDWSSDVCSSDLRALLGRIVPHGDVNPLLGKLGITGGIELAPAEIVAAAWEGKTVAIGANSGLTLERRRVNGEPRLEISGFDPRSLLALKAKGCFPERSEERRVGKEGGSTCRSGWAPYH